MHDIMNALVPNLQGGRSENNLADQPHCDHDRNAWALKVLDRAGGKSVAVPKNSALVGYFVPAESVSQVGQLCCLARIHSIGSESSPESIPSCS